MRARGRRKCQLVDIDASQPVDVDEERRVLETVTPTLLGELEETATVLRIRKVEMDLFDPAEQPDALRQDVISFQVISLGGRLMFRRESGYEGSGWVGQDDGWEIVSQLDPSVRLGHVAVRRCGGTAPRTAWVVP